MTKFNIYHNVKIQGSVSKASAVFNADKYTANTLDIKASVYDLSLRNKELLKEYSKIYNISDNINDYVFLPVPIFITNIPNKNGVAFTENEVTNFYKDIGQYMYQTWIGKPCFVEHDDSDEKASRGMIFDACLRPLSGYSIPLKQCWVLWGLDRTKDPELTKKVLTSKHNYFSMGARSEGFRCSICGKEFRNRPACQCLRQYPYMSDIEGKIACANAIDVVGTEVSYVANPAWISAEANKILEV